MPNRSDSVPLFKLMMSLFLSSHLETLFITDVCCIEIIIRMIIVVVIVWTDD